VKVWFRREFLAAGPRRIVKGYAERQLLEHRRMFGRPVPVANRWMVAGYGSSSAILITDSWLARVCRRLSRLTRSGPHPGRQVPQPFVTYTSEQLAEALAAAARYGYWLPPLVYSPLRPAAAWPERPVSLITATVR
jgi:hypothetical protein